jgi:hypothetical protein
METWLLHRRNPNTRRMNTRQARAVRLRTNSRSRPPNQPRPSRITHNLRVLARITSGRPDTGGIRAVTIGSQVHGSWHRGLERSGRLPGGVMRTTFISGTPGTGVRTSASMAALITVSGTPAAAIMARIGIKGRFSIIAQSPMWTSTEFATSTTTPFRITARVASVTTAGVAGSKHVRPLRS